jgi:hypothetical protein
MTYFSAPAVARWYVLRNYPDVKSIGEIDIHLNGSVDVYDVVVRRDGLDVEVKHVYADHEKNIAVEGGTIHLDLDKFERPESSGEGSDGSGPNITAKNISVSVRKGQHSVALHETEYDGKKACFQHGKAVVQKGVAITATIQKLFDHPNAGCFEVESKTLSLAKVTFTANLPFTVPKVEKVQQVELHWVEINLEEKSLWARNLMFITNEQAPNLNIVNLDAALYEDSIVASADTIVARHPWLTKEERGYQIDHINLFLPKEDGKPIEMDAGHLGIGGVKITANKAAWAVAAEGKCADWLEALPPINWWSMVTFDATRGDLIFSVQTKPPKIKLKVDCTIQCDLPVIANLKKKFTYTAYDKEGKPFERNSGPRSGSWVPLRILPEHVHKAFVMLEDPGFDWHKGVHRLALLNSLKINLEEGRFVRGGSTITMQLVKNIWLSREKTMDRKLKEIILATMLEGCLSKYEILELYLNVIEFGPKLYGIGPASRHYFSISPANLGPDEAVYLARLLPRPGKAVRPEDGGMDRIHKLMGKLKERGKLPEALEGFDEQLELPEIPAPPTGSEPEVRGE